jgi:midasin (ATPase involved in ribosome maturation)
MDFDRERGQEILEKYFSGIEPQTPVQFHISTDHLVVNSKTLRRKNKKFPAQNYKLDRSQFDALESLMFCIEHNWLAILVGQEGSGKTRLTLIFYNCKYFTFYT